MELVILKDMNSNRYGLYRRREGGYSAQPSGAGLVWPEDVIEAMVEKGHCYRVPSGGAAGSVKPTEQGRERLRKAAAAERAALAKRAGGGGQGRAA